MRPFPHHPPCLFFTEPHEPEVAVSFHILSTRLLGPCYVFPMRILRYNDLDVAGLSTHVDRVEQFLEKGDFRSADVKKLKGTPFYRAKLNDADRLLFRYARHGNESFLLLLEVIRNHAYASSRFLNGASVDEAKIDSLHSPADLDPASATSLVYVNPKTRHFHFLDRMLSFDDAQSGALSLHPPLILVGSAGSGKTVLTLEKLKQLSGDILYVTLSPYLAENARNLYYSSGYENDRQNVDFLSFGEFIETLSVPPGREVTYRDFAATFARNDLPLALRDTHKLYEEIHGVLTGSCVDRPYLTRDQYLALGVRQSIFLSEDRPAVYSLFEKYLRFLPENNLFNPNLVAHSHLESIQPSYDFLVADEVQDLTNVQLDLALRTLRHPSHFILCGDANQIVHPNFFSWAHVKSFFYERRATGRAEILRILDANYRNSPEVVHLANRLLLVKNARFGSIDRESNYLVRPTTRHPGLVELFADNEKTRRELNARTCRSARTAVIVLREEDKADARQHFQTPLVFSIQEAKGLEYDSVVLLNFVSANRKEFGAIVEGVSADDLRADSLAYARAKDKTDKSIDAFKFFINSFYVALTRSVKNLHLIERDPDHRLFSLLGLSERKEATKAHTETSSNEEWQQEAHRLEKQGKTDQADAIRRSVLGQKTVPWTVLTPNNLAELKAAALNPNQFNRQAKLQLFEYAAIHTSPPLLRALIALNFKPAQDPAQSHNSINTKYFSAYLSKDYRELRKQIETYGIDFRNPLNQTPLMVATLFGKEDLVRWLVENGSNPRLTDNWGCTPVQLALREAYRLPDYARNHVGHIYALVAPPFIKLRVGDRMAKIDATKMEYFLFFSMTAALQDILRVKIEHDTPAFQTGDFYQSLLDFPDHIIPAHRKTRSHLTAVLCRNEINRPNPYNRQLFIRVRRGYYVLNPLLEIETNGQWTNIYDLIHIHELAKDDEEPRLRQFAQSIQRWREQHTPKPAPLPEHQS